VDFAIPEHAGFTLVNRPTHTGDYQRLDVLEPVTLRRD
jgi:hypothetical protein